MRKKENKSEKEGKERSYPLGCTIVAEAVLATPVHPTAHGNPGARVEKKGTRTRGRWQRGHRGYLKGFHLYARTHPAWKGARVRARSPEGRAKRPTDNRAGQTKGG